VECVRGANGWQMKSAKSVKIAASAGEAFSFLFSHFWTTSSVTGPWGIPGTYGNKPLHTCRRNFFLYYLRTSLFRVEVDGSMFAVKWPGEGDRQSFCGYWGNGHQCLTILCFNFCLGRGQSPLKWIFESASWENCSFCLGEIWLVDGIINKVYGERNIISSAFMTYEYIQKQWFDIINGTIEF